MKTIEEIPALVAKFHLDGLGTLFSFGVDQDLKNINDSNVKEINFNELPKPDKNSTYNSVVSSLYNKNETATIS